MGLDQDLDAGRITTDEYIAQVGDVLRGPPHDPLAEDLAVFLVNRPEPAPDGAGEETGAGSSRLSSSWVGTTIGPW
jgi:hypothetical protein